MTETQEIVTKAKALIGQRNLFIEWLMLPHWERGKLPAPRGLEYYVIPRELPEATEDLQT